MPMLSRQGKLIPTWHHTFVIRDERGHPLRLAVVITDVTDRKAAEDALRASEERFRVTFEEAPVGMAIAVGDGVLIRANRAMCRMSGYTQEEFLGRQVRDFTHPDDQELSIPLNKALMAGEVPSITLTKRYLRKDGGFFWAHTTAVTARGPDGKIAFALGVVENITERKQAEEALRQSERRFRNYFEQGLIGMAVTSVDKRWLEVNDRLCEMLGYSQEELLRRSWTEITFPEDLEPNYRLFDQLLAGTIDHFTLNKRYFKKDGSVLYATIHTRAFREEDGTVDHIVTLVEDITARKHAEEALRRERRTLEYMLQSSDHERQLIAYDIHDGLAQQLAGAIMQFQIYDQLKDTKPDEAGKAYQSGITLLHQSHVETRRLISGVRPPILDELGVVAAIAHLVHDPAFDEGPKIEFRRKVRFHRLAPVLENVIYRIVQEGLTNARNHSQSDKILVRLIQRGDRLRIEIRDWGVGFDPKTVQENSFGLQGIRQRARLLRGTCHIHSAPGEGTTVRVELPVVALEVRG
jgi:PAS domain S-box-containing protein